MQMCRFTPLITVSFLIKPLQTVQLRYQGIVRNNVVLNYCHILCVLLYLQFCKRIPWYHHVQKTKQKNIYYQILSVQHFTIAKLHFQLQEGVIVVHSAHLSFSQADCFTHRRLHPFTTTWRKVTGLRVNRQHNREKPSITVRL